MFGAAAAGDGGLVEQWRALGPVLWAVAAGSLALWGVVVGLLAWWRDPRQVDAGPAVLDVVGHEPPAVVNLLTADWTLQHAAVPATLLDLAARRHLEIEQHGDDTFVCTRTPRRDDPLTGYETMVLDHVRALAAPTPDGRVPAPALSTGPAVHSKRWWRTFRSAVVDDARARGVSRPRWSAAARSGLLVLAAPVAVAFALAASSLPDDPSSDDDDPVGAAAVAGLLAYGGLGAVTARLGGERDTPAGRDVAARWLGLGELLGEDPLFAEQPPAAAAVWDRLLAHGTALGTAHGVVRALPLGAESDREAWSPVGGRWRVVRVRYRWQWPLLHGRPPGRLALGGAATAAAGRGVLWLLPRIERLAVEARTSVDAGSATSALPSWWDTSDACARTVGWALVVAGAAVFLAAAADLVRPPRVVEGWVVRHRTRGRGDGTHWFVAVDDGTSDRIRAYRHNHVLTGAQGDVVRLTATPAFRHVRRIEVLGTPRGAPRPTPPAPTVRTGAPPLAPGRAAPAPAAPAGPPPPLPDAGTLSAAAGRPLALAAGAPPHPLAEAGASATYEGPSGEQVQLAWTGSPVAGGLPAVTGTDAPGLGPGARRLHVGRGLVIPRPGRALLVLVHLPGASQGERDRVGESVARAALAPDDSSDPAAHR